MILRCHGLRKINEILNLLSRLLGISAKKIEIFLISQRFNQLQYYFLKKKKENKENVKFVSPYKQQTEEIAENRMLGKEPNI